jgi:hypothetical protein
MFSLEQLRERVERFNQRRCIFGDDKLISRTIRVRTDLHRELCAASLKETDHAASLELETFTWVAYGLDAQKCRQPWLSAISGSIHAAPGHGTLALCLYITIAFTNVGFARGPG